MAEWDLQPTLNRETGLPHSFMEMPLDTHLELWSAGPAKLLRQSAYAALLVSMHGSALYEMRDLDRMAAADADKVRRFLAESRAQQDELLAQLGHERAAVLVNQRLVWTWDFMSLALCLDWAPTLAQRVPLGSEVADIRLEPAGPATLTIDPWPFRAPAVTVHCEGRALDGGYADERELHAALEAAPLVPLQWRLVPA
jgi:hypothetical protein